MNIKNLKKARLNKNMTQKEVAIKIGVGQSTYTNYEAGIREPNGDTLVQLADSLGTTTDYLLGRKEKQEPYYHTKLEDSIKEAYLSLPREVRASILQAMVDAVLSYQQEENLEQSDSTIEKPNGTSTNDTEQITDETQQVDAVQEESTQPIMQEQRTESEQQIVISNGYTNIQKTDLCDQRKFAKDGNPFLIPDSEIEEAIKKSAPITPDYFED